MFADLLQEIQQKNITITFNKGKLRYEGAQSVITPAFLSKLKKHKSSLIKYYWPLKDSNLMPINVNGGKTPFILVHGDDANYLLQKEFGQDQPFIGYAHIGANGEKNSFKDTRKMAQYYLKQLLEFQPQGPYFLGGFSFGGILAYEMAVMLEERGEEVPFLALLDCKNPTLKEPYVWHKSMYWFIRSNLGSPIYQFCKNKVESCICSLFILINKPIPVKLRKNYIRRSYAGMINKYNYRAEKVNGKILLIKVSGNNSVYSDLGWKELCKELEVITLEGMHNNFMTIPGNMDMVKNKIKELMTYYE